MTDADAKCSLRASRILYFRIEFRMEDLLKQWGVNDATIIESFKANNIVVYDLSTLSEDDLRSLVPCINPRNRIKRHIAMLLESSNNNAKQTVISNPSKIVLSDEASNTLGVILMDSEETTNETGERSERSGSSGSQSRTQSITKACAEATKRPLTEATLDIDFEVYKPDTILKLSAEYPKLE